MPDTIPPKIVPPVFVPVQTAPPRKSHKALIITLVSVGVGGVVLVVLVLAGLLWLGARAKQNNAMISVFNQNKVAFDKFTAWSKLPPREKGVLSAGFDRLSNDMRAIDLTDCPEDFQEKYIAVIKAWGDLATDVRTDTGANGLARVLAGALSRRLDGPANDIKEANEAQQKFNDAWLDLCQCARSHGLKVT